MTSRLPKFGPGGNEKDFDAVYKSKTVFAPSWVASLGLDAYEYEAGQGVTGSEESFSAIGHEAAKAGVALSFHAPYFISLSSTDPVKRLNSIHYIEQSLAAASLLGANTIVVHTGSAGKISRREAMYLCTDTLSGLLSDTDFRNIKVGLETMGKKNQLGTLDEVLELCSLDEKLVPVVDFGHMNARECGNVFRSADDYRRVFDRIAQACGDRVAENLHCHFSRIEYTEGGEKKHRTFADTEWGPDFEPLMEAIYREKLSPTIICESDGTQAHDALQMKTYYKMLQQ